jgi:hypothetical protein
VLRESFERPAVESAVEKESDVGADAVAGVIGTGRGNRGRGNPEEFAAHVWDMRAAHAWTILVARSNFRCMPSWLNSRRRVAGTLISNLKFEISDRSRI